MPGTSYLTFSVDYPVPDVSAAPHLTNGYITFGSLASQYKVTPEVIATWAGILRANVSSRLLLKNKHLGSLTMQQYLREQFSQHGVSPERLVLEGPDDHFVFLKAYDRIDIALDPFPYNGGTTTTEALWQGVPVITFHGDRWASRTSASILDAAGLSHLVARDLAGYMSIASEPAELLTLRPDPARKTPRFARLRHHHFHEGNGKSLPDAPLVFSSKTVTSFRYARPSQKTLARQLSPHTRRVNSTISTTSSPVQT